MLSFQDSVMGSASVTNLLWEQKERDGLWRKEQTMTLEVLMWFRYVFPLGIMCWKLVSPCGDVKK